MTFNDLFSMFQEWDYDTKLTLRFPYEFRQEKLTVYGALRRYATYKVIRFNVNMVELRRY